MSKELLGQLFSKEQIELFGVLSSEDAPLLRPEILQRKGELSYRSVILFCVPYAGAAPNNFSLYAASKDYHLYMEELFSRLLPRFSAAFPQGRFLGFADHSPIDERRAALLCGLGLQGKHGLLITEKYASYVFIGEILSDLPAETFGDQAPKIPRSCSLCGACLAACPTGFLRGEGECLSAITQKKGALSPEEEALLRKCGTAWGCDACQEACPYVKKMRKEGVVSPIPFFLENRISVLTYDRVAEMPEEEFRQRAFAWRGKKTILRNLAILESDGGPEAAHENKK